MITYHSIENLSSIDQKEFIKLLNDTFGKQQRYKWIRDEKYIQWKYEDNVFGKPFIHQIKKGDKIIGSSTLWPWQLSCRGEIFKVYQPCDTVVHPDFQGQGLFSKLNNYRIPDIRERGIPFVYNFPNEKSVNGYLKFGWMYLEKLSWLIKVKNPIGLIAINSGKLKGSPVQIFETDRINIVECHNVSKTQEKFFETISTNRIEGYFKWRFNDHPFFKYGQVIAGTGRKKTGAIFCINQFGSNKEFIVVEIFGHPSNLNELFKEIEIRAKTYQASYIITLQNSFYNTKKLYRWGYFKVRNKNMVLLPFVVRLETIFTKYENWNINAAMHDSI